GQLSVASPAVRLSFALSAIFSLPLLTSAQQRFVLGIDVGRCMVKIKVTDSGYQESRMAWI
ncbi:MAG: hypothetical protein WAU15_08610, partial [Nitrosomonas sp.]